MIELGVRAKDRITGFTGIVTARVTYIWGCDRYILTPEKRDKEGRTVSPEYFDEQQIEVVTKKPVITAINAEAATKGGPLPFDPTTGRG